MPEPLSDRPDWTNRLTTAALQALQDEADRAAFDRAPDAGELRDRASRARGINAVQNWTLANLTRTDAEIDEQVARMSLGYGVPADDLRKAADYTLTAVKAGFA